MQILTPSGYRDITACHVGDEVAAFDIASGAPIVNTIETLQWIDAQTYRDWQNPIFLINGEEHFGLHSLFVLRLPKNAPQPVMVSDVATGDQVFRIDAKGEFIFDYEITSIVQVDPYRPFKFFRINGTWTLNSEQSIWRNGGEVCHAKDLVVGDVIYDDADRDVPISSIEEDAADGWWRFDISGDHSYIVDGLTLHNASRFWVGGAGNLDGSTTTHIAATTGGAGGASYPTSADSLTLDANSGGGTVTVTATVNFLSITCGAHTGTLDFSANNNNVTLVSFSGTGTGTRTLNLGNGTWTITGTGTCWTIATITNLTFNANSSVIVFSLTSASAHVAAFGALTYSTVTISANTSGGGFIFNSNNTVIGTLNVSPPNDVSFFASGGGTLTITNAPAWTGTSTNQLNFHADGTGNLATVVLSGGSPTAVWSAFREITFTTTTLVATNSFSLGRVIGATITAPSAGGGGSGRFSAAFF